MKRKHLLLMAMMVLVMAFVIMGCKPDQTPAPNNQGPDNLATPDYVGSETCKACHSGQHKTMIGTEHHTTFKPLSAYNISNLPQQITVFETSNEQSPVSATIDLANAYGVMVDHYVIAPVPETAGFTSDVYRVAALAKQGDQWTLEPARTGDFNNDGKEDWGISAYTCGGCHSPGIEHGSEEYTISCESCHGPGGDHISAENKKGTMTVSQDSCLACHESNPKKNDKGVYEANNHYGTRNYFASKHAQSTQLNNCLTCHDPHKANAEGKLLTADSSTALCSKCHDQKFNIDSIMWKNPTDARNHFTRDHSFGAMPYNQLGDDKDTKPVEITNPDMVKLIEDNL